MALPAAAGEEKYKFVLDMASGLGRVIMGHWLCKSSDASVKTSYRFARRSVDDLCRDEFNLQITDRHHQLRR